MLQSAIHEAVSRGVLPPENSAGVQAELDALQRSMTARGYLKPPRRKRMLASIFPSQRAREGKVSADGVAALNALRGNHPAPTAPPPPQELGRSVGLYGTRPLFMAIPPAAALGWTLYDHPDPNKLLHETGSSNTFSCSSSVGDGGSTTHHGSDHHGCGGGHWCGSGNSCGSGGSCNSGSCSSSGCSSGSCGGGSSCGSSCGGGSCSS